jgi:hypothetical protein
VWAQRYTRTGVRLGTEFLASANVAYDDRSEFLPAISPGTNGEFVVAWNAYYADRYRNTRIGAQRLDGSGALLGDEVRVSEPTDFQFNPAVGIDGTGAFVVAWQNGFVGQFRGFEPTGQAATEELPVSIAQPGSAYYPAVLGLPGGGFIIAWAAEPRGSGGGIGIYARRLSSSGLPVGDEFQLNVYTASHHWRPALAPQPDGGFVAVWRSDGQDGSDYGVFGRRFGIDGTPRGVEFQANEYTTDKQEHPQVAADADGSFLVVWESTDTTSGGPNGQDGDGRGIFGRAFDSSGAPLGSEFQVNTRTEGNQGRGHLRELAVANYTDGEFIVTWTTPDDGWDIGIDGQRLLLDPSLGPVCGDAARKDLTVTVDDALDLLRVSTGLQVCDDCVCDADSSGSVTATDALRALQNAIGLDSPLVCPPCA